MRKGAPADPALGWREEEPIWYPEAYDKFHGGEILEFLTAHGSEHIVIIGSATNNCVLYSATTAARHLPYTTYVPIDGSYAEDPYCHEYALYQLSVLPSPPRKIIFTTLAGTTFS